MPSPPPGPEAADLRRSFIAIPLPEEYKKHLEAVQRQIGAILPPIRWSRFDNLHLTLRFLGDRNEETLEQVAVSMLSVARLSAAFEIHFQQLGAFPTPRRARVIWLGPDSLMQLTRLHRKLDDALRSCGIPPDEKPFRPHLTLGRIRGRPLDLSEPLTRLGAIDGGRLRIGSMVLYESRLLPGAARHLPRAEANLGGVTYSDTTAD
ncbi:RNA 2',3'-cyclic phosphodiesterase [Geothermobacter hydrogeniphilus]|nr:RNA 2',3'-cyclic phosphodiesterase [Geothermobacter hydrogeniphilus]